MKRIATHLLWMAAMLLPCLTAHAQLGQRILDHYLRAPQEKIYLQTDRNYYLAGDSLWYRAHLVDAVSQLPASSPLYPEGRSKFVYVELHDNAADTLIHRSMLKQDTLGVFAHAFALPKRLKSGGYTLVAYTRRMMQSPKEMFAYKEIGVSALQSDTAAVSSNKTNDDSAIDIVAEVVTDSLAASPRLSIAALPEGGHLLVGHLQCLAFKAVESNGYGVDVEVRLVRTDTEEIITTTRSQHRGMGSLHFTPQAGVKYRLDAFAYDGLSCYTMVPDALEKGVTLSVTQRKGHLYITPIAEGIDLTRLSLAIYGSGNLLVVDQLTPDKPLSIATASLRPGVVNIAIADTATKQVFAERLVFL